MKGKESTKVRSLLFAGKYGTLLCLFAMIVVFSILLPAFRSSNNVLNLLGQTAILSIMAAGMTCTLKMGDFDLSIGAIAALTGIVTAKILLAGGGIPLAIASGLLTGLMAGFINGIFVAYIGLNAFVCTLATMSIIFGLCLTVTKGIMLFGLPEAFEFYGRGDVLGVPFRFIIMFFLLLVLWFFHHYTPTGRRMEALGGNPVSAQLSGIKVEWNRLIGYMLSGICAAAAGVLLASSTMSATSTQGAAYLLDAFGASFIGAATVRLGQFHIPGTFVGVLIVVIAVNGLVILMVPGYLTDMIKGIILLLAIMLSGVVGKFLQTGR
jgi:ribose transport system permease protein